MPQAIQPNTWACIINQIFEPNYQNIQAHSQLVDNHLSPHCLYKYGLLSIHAIGHHSPYIHTLEALFQGKKDQK